VAGAVAGLAWVPGLSAQAGLVVAVTGPWETLPVLLEQRTQAVAVAVADLVAHLKTGALVVPVW